LPLFRSFTWRPWRAMEKRMSLAVNCCTQSERCRRLAHGLGAATGGRCGRRVVRNECTRPHFTAVYSFLTTLLTHGQAFAWPPSLGGQVQLYSPWPSMRSMVKSVVTRSPCRQGIDLPEAFLVHKHEAVAERGQLPQVFHPVFVREVLQVHHDVRHAQ